MTLPNFIIIGAAKAGTTSLYEHFRAHPEIFMPRLKEPRFFCYGGQGDRLRFPVQSEEEYEALFDGAGGAKAVGEASVHYLTDSSAASRIQTLLPNVKLIASLRNPVDRSYSIYQMNRRNAGANVNLPYAKALHEDTNLQDAYHLHLKRFFTLFPREKIKVILLEDLESRPQPTVVDLFKFVEVDPNFVPDLTKVANPGGEPRIEFLHRLLSDRRLVAASRKVLPEAVVTPLKTLRARNLTKRPLPDEDRRTATDFFREDILRTQDLIGRDLSHWLRA